MAFPAQGRLARTRTSPDVVGNAAAGGSWVTGHFSRGSLVSSRCTRCTARSLGADGCPGHRRGASCRIRPSKGIGMPSLKPRS